ncbi:mercuric transport protein MerTP [uncultured Flavobacterium sp.]|uniref:mercuric transport protein MerTP n=1 Tax=uncultured Flavobacterium sp. TaxID=165435 RepID=UPI0030EB4F80|tara:strand:+ start:4372 stop:5004 length:633 start_codon:yes stop_codon:yes gene_type:complete
MKTKSGKLAGAGILSAIAASLCCITPFLALLSGASGAASAFSWLESFRPYLIGITILVLGFAWHQKLKPRTAEEIQCDCDEDNKTPFMQTKTFLGIVTAFSIIMMAFPYYGQIFYPKTDKQIVVVSSNNIQEAQFNVSGMTCSSCEEHIKHAVNKLSGIVSVTANHSKGMVFVKFDNTKTNKEALVKAINATGYKVSSEMATAENPSQGK